MSSHVTARPLITTVILNTNRRQDTLACLASLEKNTYPNQAILVLDNASTDGSVEAIQQTFPSIEVIMLDQNLGYAGNNNVGIAAALERGSDWLFVLNEDTILADDCLSQLVSVGESDSQIGIIGPLVYHYDEPNLIQSGGGRLDRYWRSCHIAENQSDVGQLDKPQDVDWVSGCAIMLRREVIEDIGALDERFFYYWEETEWCVRASKHGWRVVLVPEAKIWHKGVQRDYRPSATVTYYNTRNRFLAMAKHRAPLSAWLVAWKQTLHTLTSWTLRPRWRNMREHRDAMWQGARDFVRRRYGVRPT